LGWGGKKEEDCDRSAKPSRYVPEERKKEKSSPGTRDTWKGRSEIRRVGKKKGEGQHAAKGEKRGTRPFRSAGAGLLLRKKEEPSHSSRRKGKKKTRGVARQKDGEVKDPCDAPSPRKKKDCKQV